MELRKGYKQTEVGMIPEDWDVITLGDNTIKVGSGITPKGGSSVYKETGRPFMRSQNVGWGVLKLNDIAFIDEETHALFPASEIKQKDVLLNITGASIGRCALASFEVTGGNVNQHVCVIRTKDKLLDAGYLCRVLLSDIGQGQIDSFQAGGNREGLNFGQIKSFNIPLPPTKTEQTAIANALSDADAWIQSLILLIAKKRQIKQGTMQTLLNPYENGHLKAGWVEKKLGDIAHFINGRAYSLTEWETQGTPVIRLQNLTGRGEKYYYSNLRLPEKQYCVAGDLLFMWSATFGPVIWEGEKAIYHYHIWKIECKPVEANKKYLFYILDDLTERLKKSSSSGGTMLHVTKEKMESTEIILPNMDEQTKTASILSDMDNEITALETKLAKAQQIKQGMMQNLLTGRIRLI